jgi:hypothetical protein
VPTARRGTYCRSRSVRRSAAASGQGPEPGGLAAAVGLRHCDHLALVHPEAVEQALSTVDSLMGTKGRQKTQHFTQQIRSMVLLGGSARFTGSRRWPLSPAEIISPGTGQSPRHDRSALSRWRHGFEPRWDCKKDQVNSPYFLDDTAHSISTPNKFQFRRWHSSNSCRSGCRSGSESTIRVALFAIPWDQHCDGPRPSGRVPSKRRSATPNKPPLSRG